VSHTGSERRLKFRQQSAQSLCVLFIVFGELLGAPAGGGERTKPTGLAAGIPDHPVNEIIPASLR